MLKVIIIGSGNVAQHLIVAFQKNQTVGTEIELAQVFSRKKAPLLQLLDSDQITTDFSAIDAADLYIIAVSDDAIASVADQLPFKNRLVVHTSGSVALDSLNKKQSQRRFLSTSDFY